MILRSFLKVPMKLITLPTFTDKWDITEVAYYVACDAVMGGIRKPEMLDYTVNGIYNWLEALIEEEDFHITDLIAEQVFNIILTLFNNRDFMMAVNTPYELTECSVRVHRWEKYVTFYFEYEDSSVYNHI